MLKAIYVRLDSWHETLKIKFFHPELYRDLTRPLCEADLVPVEAPWITTSDALAEVLRVKGEIMTGLRGKEGFVGAGVYGTAEYGYRVKVLLETEDCEAAMSCPPLIRDTYIDQFITGSIRTLPAVTTLELIDEFLERPETGHKRSRPKKVINPLVL